MLNTKRHGDLSSCRRLLPIVATFLLSWQACAYAGSVGFQVVHPTPDVKVDIWYPTKAAATEHDVGLFTQTVAPDAPIDGRAHGLIVVSHGTGGTAEEHYDTDLALARAGFIVAALQHPGDNYQDNSRATHIEDRPKAIHALIDYLVTAWSGHAAIDPKRIGMFGFSSGGFTTLVAIGAIPDMGLIGSYCTTHTATFVCTLLKAHPVEPGAPEPVWVADPRIKAAVVAAPAIGFVFSRNGLAGVHVPVQLWRAQDDHILPAPDYAEPVAQGLPGRVEYHVVPGADHFDFLAPCTEALAHVAPEICEEHDGFDRTAFHRAFDKEVVGFFEKTLGR